MPASIKPTPSQRTDCCEHLRGDHHPDGTCQRCSSCTADWYGTRSGMRREPVGERLARRAREMLQRQQQTAELEYLQTQIRGLADRWASEGAVGAEHAAELRTLVGGARP